MEDYGATDQGTTDRMRATVQPTSNMQQKPNLSTTSSDELLRSNSSKPRSVDGQITGSRQATPGQGMHRSQDVTNDNPKKLTLKTSSSRGPPRKEDIVDRVSASITTGAVKTTQSTATNISYYDVGQRRKTAEEARVRESQWPAQSEIKAEAEVPDNLSKSEKPSGSVHQSKKRKHANVETDSDYHFR